MIISFERIHIFWDVNLYRNERKENPKISCEEVNHFNDRLTEVCFDLLLH